MPLHYVMSEIAICIAAVWGAHRLWLNRRVSGAVGVMFYGLAALTGIVRIASGADDVFAPAHRLVSQAGGAAGLVLIVSEMARLRGLSLPLWVVLTGAGAASLAALQPAAWGGLVFLGLLAAGVILLAADGGRKRGRMLALWFAVMAPNILLVRRSPLLDPGVSWHAYHLITAFWLVAVIAALRPARPVP